MKKVEIRTFVQEGRKEVIKFSSPPQLFDSPEMAIEALNQAIEAYRHTCGKGYNEFRAPDNPFVAIIIHGIND